MPKAGSCAVCEHDQQGAVETALQAGVALRTVADQYGVSKTTLIRHKEHIAACASTPAKVREGQSQDSQLVLLANKAKALETEITNALRSGHAVDYRWALQDIARILVGLAEYQVGKRGGKV